MNYSGAKRCTGYAPRCVAAACAAKLPGRREATAAAGAAAATAVVVAVVVVVVVVIVVPAPVAFVGDVAFAVAAQSAQKYGVYL